MAGVICLSNRDNLMLKAAAVLGALVLGCLAAVATSTPEPTASGRPVLATPAGASHESDAKDARRGDAPGSLRHGG